MSSEGGEEDRDPTHESAEILERERANQSWERAWFGRTLDILTAERDEARAEATMVAQRLRRIETGRWWRIRGLLLKLAGMLGRRYPRSRAPISSKDTNQVVQRGAAPTHVFGRARVPLPSVGQAVLGYWPEVAGNPYQRMLYGGMSESDVTPIPLAEVRDAQALTDGGGAAILHIHWTSPVLHEAKSELEARRLMWRFVATLDELRASGCRMIWTVHNVLPHDCRFPEVEARLAQSLADRCDAIHVMCEATSGVVAGHYILPRSRIHVIQHPSYIDVYPNELDQAAARRTLGVEPDATVLLSFGGVRPYKRLEVLLDSFEEVHKAKPDTRLILAGDASRFPNRETLTERCRRQPGVVAVFERIPDRDVQRYMNSADVVVLPQRAPLNSGALMLAFSFARPVVAARAGCVIETVSEDVGFTFDPDQPEGLTTALLQSDRLKDRRYREAALARALQAHPTVIARRFASLVSSIGRP